MATEKRTEDATETTPSLKRLRRTRAKARSEAKTSKGIFRRIKLTIWQGWLWLLVRAAEASLKQILGVFGLILLIVFIFILNPAEEEPQYGLDHSFAIESPEFISTIAGATNAPF